MENTNEYFNELNKHEPKPTPILFFGSSMILHDMWEQQYQKWIQEERKIREYVESKNADFLSGIAKSKNSKRKSNSTK